MSQSLAELRKVKNTDNKLNIGFYYHVPGYWNNNRVFLPTYFGRFIQGLADRCSHLTCFLHETTDVSSQKMCDFSIKAKNITFVNIGKQKSAALCTLFPYVFVKPFKNYSAKLDAIIIRGPSPLLPAISRFINQSKIILYLAGNYAESSSESTVIFWRRWLIQLWIRWYSQEQKKIGKRNYVIVNSQKLFVQLKNTTPNLKVIRSTTLKSADFYLRKDTCDHKTIRLLYTGRYSYSKGLFDVVEAMSLLKNQEIKSDLHLIGWPDKNEQSIIDELSSYAKSIGVAGRIQDHGYLSVGSDYFQVFRKSDIFVLASRSSEGFPRVVWEAMSQCLPVITTSVGSIPYFLKNGIHALIVPPKSSIDIHNALLSIVYKGNLRRQMIRNAYNYVKENTIERRSKEMIDQVQKWVTE